MVPSVEIIMRNRIKQLEIISSRSRPIICDVIISCIAGILASLKKTEETASRCSILFMITPCLLFMPKKSTVNADQLSNVVGKRCTRWLQDEIVGLWENANEVASKAKLRPHAAIRYALSREDQEQNMENNAARAVRLAKGGYFSKVCMPCYRRGCTR